MDLCQQNTLTIDSYSASLFSTLGTLILIWRQWFILHYLERFKSSKEALEEQWLWHWMQWHFIVDNPQHCCPHFLLLITAFSLGFTGLTVFFQLLEETYSDSVCITWQNERQPSVLHAYLFSFLKTSKLLRLLGYMLISKWEAKHDSAEAEGLTEFRASLKPLQISFPKYPDSQILALNWPYCQNFTICHL